MATAAQQVSAANDADDIPEPKLFDIDYRGSLELVVALVGPLGSGVTTVYEQMASKLNINYGYDPVYVKMSGIIQEYAHEVDHDITSEIETTTRIDLFQTVGNELREARRILSRRSGSRTHRARTR